jgi:D-alanyl-D-alanine carboxypeptidase
MYMFDRPSVFSTSTTSKRRLLTFGVSIITGVVLIILAKSNVTLFTASSQEPLQGTTSIADSVSVVVKAPAYQPPAAPVRINDTLNTATFTAAGVLVRDVESGVVLYESGGSTVRSVASITKLLTALTLIDMGLDWRAEAPVVADDGLIDTHMYAGDVYSTEDLWLSMLVASSNKAAMTLVDMVAPSRDVFVARMNDMAASLGMTQSTFVEPTGLNALNVSTPRDISLLLDAALAVPSIREGLRTPEHSIDRPAKNDTHRMWNTNWLLIDWIPNDLYQVIGGKTGYIDASLYNFTARIVTVDGYILDVVIFGAPTHEARFTVARDAIIAVLGSYDWHADSSLDVQ